jgi:hypothetical protein
LLETPVVYEIGFTLCHDEWPQLKGFLKGVCGMAFICTKNIHYCYLKSPFIISSLTCAHKATAKAIVAPNDVGNRLLNLNINIVPDGGKNANEPWPIPSSNGVQSGRKQARTGQ